MSGLHGVSSARRIGIPFDSWGAINAIEARKLAKNPVLSPLRFRIMWAAFGWANRLGHAEFVPGGLAEVLKRPNASSGIWSRPARQHINREIEVLITMGLLDPASTSRCLVLPTTLYGRNAKAGASCQFHRLRVNG